MAKKPSHSPVKWDDGDVGVYAESSRGFHGMLSRIVALAVSQGMTKPSKDDIEEFPDEVWDETEEWMNEELAEEGFVFETTEQGDWGYFPIEEED